SNNGSSPSSPVRSFKRAEGLIRNGAGDQILLQRGDTFHDNFGYFKWSGTPGQPTLIGAYGSGSRPVVSSGSSNALQIDPGTHGVAGLLLEENVFDHKGWGHGAGQTMFNHGAYVTATSSGLVAGGDVFSNASGFGLQARGGGDVQGNVFYNNANGFSFGLVSGS